MIIKTINKIAGLHDKFAPILSDVFLLLVRIQWGFGFFQAGLGKLRNFERTVGFFGSLGIPAPEINAWVAASTELLGGILLLFGLGSRIVPLPLIFTMIIAYLTAHNKELASLLMFPDIKPFLEAPPFLFLMACLIVFLFGPGKFSLDRLFKKQ